MFFTAATAVSALGALSAFGTVEASLGSRGNSKSSCQSGYFWYDRLSCCLKTGGETTTAPSGSSCPSNLYWHTTEKCCVPKSSDVNQQVPSSCPSGSSWNNISWCCKSTTTSSSTSCSKNNFYWAALNTCVSTGSSNENPPSGYSCPSNWSWLSSKSCCKPNQETPSTSTPTCNNSWTWHPGKQCCVPGESTPTPSNAPGTQGRKRHAAMRKRTGFCPSNYESCPILDVSGRSTESECLDTRTELTSCGGCTSIGKGQDCSAIPYSKVSTCQAGRCVVEKCKAGYEISATGDSCVSQGHAML